MCIIITLKLIVWIYFLRSDTLTKKKLRSITSIRTIGYSVKLVFTIYHRCLPTPLSRSNFIRPYQDGGSANDLFSGLGVIYKVDYDVCFTCSKILSLKKILFMNTSCFEYICHCRNKSQAHYQDRKSQSNLVQFCPIIPNHLQLISTFKCFHLDLQTT